MRYLLILVALISGPVLADSSANAGAVSGSQSQSASGSIAATHNNTEFSYASTVHGSDLKESVPNMFVPSLAASTNPCTVSVSVGATGPGLGVAVGKAYTDKQCQVRENLRLLAAISSPGDPEMQMVLRETACQNVSYWDAFERVANHTGDSRFKCLGPRPAMDDDVTVRDVALRGNNVKIKGAKAEPKPVQVSTKDCAGSGVLCGG